MPTSFPIPIPYAPTGFVNQAALDTAFTVPINDAAALANAALAGQSLLGETTTGANVVLSTTSNFASTASITFTLTTQTRVMIQVQSTFTLASGIAGRYGIRAGYNSGSSPVIGSVIGVGQQFLAAGSIAGGLGGAGFGTALLAAGQWTAYAIVQRFSGGSATDTAGAFEVLVTGVGFS